MSRKAQNTAPTTCRLPCTEATFERYHKARNPKETWDQMLNRVLNGYGAEDIVVSGPIGDVLSLDDARCMSDVPQEEIPSLIPVNTTAVQELQKKVESEGATLAPVEINVPETLHQI